MAAALHQNWPTSRTTSISGTNSFEEASSDRRLFIQDLQHLSMFCRSVRTFHGRRFFTSCSPLAATMPNTNTNAAGNNVELDVLVIGGGFGGCYLLKKLRESGFKTKLIDAAPRLGGVWAWNRYQAGIDMVTAAGIDFSQISWSKSGCGDALLQLF